MESRVKTLNLKLINLHGQMVTLRKISFLSSNQSISDLLSLEKIGKFKSQQTEAL